MTLPAAAPLGRLDAASSSTRWARRIAIGGIAVWGLLHVVGGGALVGTAYTDGPRAAFE